MSSKAIVPLLCISCEGLSRISYLSNRDVEVRKSLVFWTELTREYAIRSVWLGWRIRVFEGVG